MAGSVRVLGDADLDAALAILRRQDVANVFVTSRLEAAGLDPIRLGAEVWGYTDRGRLRSLCYAGANLVPVDADEAALRQFAERARQQGRRCSSIVGPAHMVDSMWKTLSQHWGPCRELRTCQPLLVTRQSPTAEPDPLVRRVRVEELDILLPASIAMFTEEVGISPIAGDGGALYRTRVRELVSAGRSFARIENGRIVFKAEIGAITRAACQVQGVWVDPELRGRQLSIGGMAAVVATCLREVAPAVSLYVNDFNHAARRTYDRVGFIQEGEFASVLF